MKEQFNREAKEGWRFAADAARITDERASSEDRKHTSGGVLVAVDSNIGAIVGAEEGAIHSISGNEGRIAQAWVNVRGGLRFFSVFFWHSAGRKTRNEALPPPPTSKPSMAKTKLDCVVPSWTHNLNTEKPAATPNTLCLRSSSFKWVETCRPRHYHGTQRAHSNAIQAG